MPVHIIECYECGDREERNVMLSEKEFECRSCGAPARIVYDWGTMSIEIFQPFIDKEFLKGTPTKIESKSDWARKCEQNGVVSHALANSYKSYGKRREI